MRMQPALAARDNLNKKYKEEGIKTVNGERGSTGRSIFKAARRPASLNKRRLYVNAGRPRKRKKARKCLDYRVCLLGQNLNVA